MKITTIENKYWELSNEEKRKKREYGRNTYQNMSEEDEQRLKEYQKTIVKQNNQHKNLSFFSLQSIKIEQQALIFDKQCINKNPLHKNKRPVSINILETRIIISSKYFIGYICEGNAFPIQLCIKLPQMNGYVKYFVNSNKCINLLVHNKELLKKYNEYGIRLVIY